ncbi:MAG: hypothetical protein ACI9KN_000286 [Gammaproteobacteria bacterium]|jgi:hypothetical protein
MIRSYMVVENFFPGSKDAIYERFHARGRMLPDGLEYVDSWLTLEGNKCFQLMSTDDFSLFEAWIEHWKDLGSFEIVELGPKPEV